MIVRNVEIFIEELKKDLAAIVQAKLSFEDTTNICVKVLYLLDNIVPISTRIATSRSEEILMGKEIFADKLKYTHRECYTQLMRFIEKSDKAVFTDIANYPAKDQVLITKTIFILKEPPGA